MPAEAELVLDVESAASKFLESVFIRVPVVSSADSLTLGSINPSLAVSFFGGAGGEHPDGHTAADPA